MFTQFDKDKNDDSNDNSIVGSTDITDPENLGLKKVSFSLTHKDTQFPLHDPVDEKVRPEEQLSTQEVLNVFEKLSGNGVEKLTITGGEPTLRHDFRTIVQYAVKKFDDVLVQTNGTTDRNLSQHDVTVSIPVEYMNPIDNNEVRRMTDPDRWLYDRKQGVLQSSQATKSKISGEVHGDRQKATSSIANKREQSIELFNKKTGEDCESWSEVKKNSKFDWSIFLEREEPRNLLEHEQALQLAIQKETNLSDDTPLIIRTNIYSNNDVAKVIAYAQMADAKVVLKPLYPVGKSKRLLEQLPRPERFMKVMQMARDIDKNIKQDIEVDSPLYKAWKYEKNLDEKQQPEIDKETYMNWWKRGRVSDVGISTMHIGPDGTCMPSKFIRQDEYNLGNINNTSVESILQNMSDFNENVMVDDDLEPVTEFDLRQRSIATDLNVALTKPYPQAKMEVN